MKNAVLEALQTNICVQAGEGLLLVLARNNSTLPKCLLLHLTSKQVNYQHCWNRLGLWRPQRTGENFIIENLHLLFQDVPTVQID